MLNREVKTFGRGGRKFIYCLHLQIDFSNDGYLGEDHIDAKDWTTMETSP
jgi:hypothetical protein